MAKKPDLSSAYALETPEDNRRLYADWATTYDQDFAEKMAYQLPDEVATAYAHLHADGPVLDLGAGTGLVGERLISLGVDQVDGTDISAEMLEIAGQKGVYRKLFEGDLTMRLPVEDDSYAGAVSAGTFTHGHVGPDALTEVLRVVRPGGWIVVSVNAAHWDVLGFESVVTDLRPALARIRAPRVAIYGKDNDTDHARDQAVILHLCKA